jgi:hypothetical protein
MISTAAAHCRLCDGRLQLRFELTVLDKYKVDYLECKYCNSLQTEAPYWMHEAYLTTNLAVADTGAAQRTISNLAACYAIAKLFRLTNCIDFGGGDGLLCRLLRDHNFNCYVTDKYAAPTYGQGYSIPNFDVTDLASAFEVIEHFQYPKSDLDILFQYRPKLVLVTTGIYIGQDKNWWYLSPNSGQHIFFYSKKSLHIIAKKYNYQLLISGGYALFYEAKHSYFFRKYIAWFILKSPVIKLMRAFVVLIPAKGFKRDNLDQIKKY